MPVSKPVDDAQVWMSGDYSDDKVEFRQAIVREGLSKLTEMTVVFQSHLPDLDLTQFIGQKMKVHLETAEGQEREFGGICISVESLGFRSGHFQFVAEVRPQFWVLTKSRDCRVFQDMTTQEIVEKILSDAGFKDYKFNLSDSYEKRQYCVQYRETDYDFICRLVEQEGIYFYFDTKNGYREPDELTFCDGKTSHNWDVSVIYEPSPGEDFSRRQISEWAPTRTVTTGKVTLEDFEFFTPSVKKAKTEKAQSTGYPFGDREIYDFPGRFRAEGDTPQDKPVKDENERARKRALVRLEAEACRHQTWRGASSVQTLGVGRLFEMTEHPEGDANIAYLVTGAVHYLNASMDIRNDATNFDLKPRRFDLPEEKEGVVYSATLEAIDAEIQFRAPLRTAWPVIPGLQTAVVVGPSGEEIWTDDYGRIRVQFPWDRIGENNETSSCWIRVATPWAGKNWGFSAVPRIGQEVVVQFEDGDPSRPICTGMLYNEDNPKVYSKKETSTEIGIRTDSTKNVSDAEAYNELMFDDTADAELMRVQAQKNHQFLTKNISRIGVGLETSDELKDYGFQHADDGSLLQVVKNHVEEEIQEGDHYYTVTTGSQEKLIHTNYIQTVETGDNTTTVQTGNHVTEVDTGNHETTVSTGNMTTSVDTGNHETTVGLGNLTVNVNTGKIEMEAMQKIVLKVGPSKITIDMTGVKIEGPMLKFEGTGMAEMKAPMTTVKGDAMLIVKGGVTMIN